MPKPSSAPLTIHQLKVNLKDIRPSIWRRLQVPSDIGLRKLHKIIQIAFGWQDYHLHEFRIGPTVYGIPDPDYETYEMEVLSDVRVKLGQVAPAPKAKFVYVYDFGDDWQHQVVVEALTPPEPGVQYPICTDGKRHAPPEDVGGTFGYAEFLYAIRHPRHEDHDRMLLWAGGRFDPEEFDMEAVNRRLRRVR